MTHQKALFEFLSTFIKIQIKKYVSLATFGVGPDARLNAHLVFNEVNELLGFAQQLLQEIETDTKDDETFINVIKQVQFYLDQEYVRAYAGWLLAENNIHTPVKERVTEQLQKLELIAQLINLDISAPSTPWSEVQQQCEHDSHAIALRILELAQKLRTNPQMALEKVPEHAIAILRANATGRYIIFAEEIDRLYQIHDDFISHSKFDKSSTKLHAEEAKLYQIEHNDRLHYLLNKYKTLNPAASIFSADHKEYEVAIPDSAIIKNPEPKPKSNYYNKTILFGGVTVGILAVYMLLQYLTELTEGYDLMNLSDSVMRKTN